MLARFCAFVTWALVAATVVFWGLRLVVRPTPAPAYTLAVGDSTVIQGDLARLLGSSEVRSVAAPVPAVEAPSRFRLLGVMALRANAADRGGVALIAVDGKPARAFAVGTRLDDDLMLSAVSLRSASIAPVRGGTSLTLEMPPLTSAATGALVPIGGAPVPQVRPLPSFQSAPQMQMAPQMQPQMQPQGLPGSFGGPLPASPAGIQQTPRADPTLQAQ